MAGPAAPADALPVRTLAGLAGALARVNAPLTRWGRDLAALLVAAMVGLATAPIVARGFFDYGLDWAEELARATLVWSVLCALPYAYRAGAHVAIDSFAMALPPRLLLAVSLAVTLLVLWVSGVFFVESLRFWQRGLTIVSSTMGFQVAWIYTIVPVSFALLVSVGLELAARLARSFWSPDPELALAGAVPGVKQGS